MNLLGILNVLDDTVRTKRILTDWKNQSKSYDMKVHRDN